MECSETIVYLASNEPAEREWLTNFCISEGLALHICSSAHDFILTARDDRATCLILDLSFSDVNMQKLQSDLHHVAGPPIIFLTASGDLSTGVRAIRNGAIDFLQKPVAPCLLRAAVEMAFDRDRKQRKERFELRSLLICWKTLTPRETEVLQLTVAGLLNKQGASELGVTENTYQVHRGRVMRKMNASSLADLVRMATKIEPILGSLRYEEHDEQSLIPIIGVPIREKSRLPSSSTSKWAANMHGLSRSVVAEETASRRLPEQ